MKNYKFRKSNFIEYSINMLLQPLMYFVGAKDSHWWDWDDFEINQNELKLINLLKTGSGNARRKYPKSKIFGMYNFSQAKSLFLTLCVLPDVAIVQPKNFDGKWSLVSYKEHISGKPKSFKLCRFLASEKVKHLIDGEIWLIGLSEENKLLELELVEITSRHKNKHLIFV